MNHEHQLAELLSIYGADPTRWPKEHRSIVPENEWPEAVRTVYAEEQTLDQILDQDAIPTESAQLQRAIEKTVLDQQTSILERWFISLNEPFRAAIAYALVLGIGIAANDLVTYVNEPISMDSQDAVAWVEQYLGDSLP
ncbi:MAG: hypothetical protein VW349_00745 [Gammaproteobacteria bacterium]